MGYLALVAGCNIGKTWKLDSGKGYTCQGLIFAKRNKAIKKLCGADKADDAKQEAMAAKKEQRKAYELSTK